MNKNEHGQTPKNEFFFQISEDSDTLMYGCITSSCRILFLLIFVNVYIFWLEKYRNWVVNN